MCCVLFYARIGKFCPVYLINRANTTVGVQYLGCINGRFGKRQGLGLRIRLYNIFFHMIWLRSTFTIFIIYHTLYITSMAASCRSACQI